MNWAEAVKDAEIEYLAITSRHHAGFRPEKTVTLELPLVPLDVTIPGIGIFLN